MGYRVADFCYGTGQEAESAFWAGIFQPIMPIPGQAATLTGMPVWETGYYLDTDPVPKYAYLVSCEDAGPMGASASFMFDLAAFNAGMSGVIALWAVGFGVGLIISVIRKLRSAK